MNIKIKTEEKRRIIQEKLDKAKTLEERNKLGQYATPSSLANAILKHTRSFIPENERIRFLDPSIGTGSFYSALLANYEDNQISKAVGYEIDAHYALPAIDLWANFPLKYEIGDFTKVTPPESDSDRFNLIVCNPPYVRHHHINGQKSYLQEAAFKACNVNLSGLSGLYCYFIALSHKWISKDGISVWLVPSEFMEVNYGEAIRKYLTSEVTLLHIHRFDPNEVQFKDALVTSSIVWFKNRKPSRNHIVKFTYGGSITNPTKEKGVSINTLSTEKKWTRFPFNGVKSSNNHTTLNDYFTVKRGIATGDNKYFILSESEIEERNLPFHFFKPILPSPRYLKDDIIYADDMGMPKLDKRLYVLDCSLSIEEIKNYPTLYKYLQDGIEKGVAERYLCKGRKSWYFQEVREESNLYFTYMGRSEIPDKKVFRFILNYSKAIVTNSYLIIYPKPLLRNILLQRKDRVKDLYDILSNIADFDMLEEGRVYGGGLHKMEPKEFLNLPAQELEEWVISITQ
jgi:hypothetical protein